MFRRAVHSSERCHYLRVRAVVPGVLSWWVLAVVSGVVPAAAAHAQERLSGRVIGRVVAQDDGSPVAGAEVRIRGTTLFRVSDEKGRFTFEGVPPGARVLETAHISYRVRTDSLLVPPEETLEVVIPLAPDPVPLAPLIVSVRSKVLEVSGFYSRREQGYSGTFLTREQIEERKPARLTDLFASIPWARLAQRDGVVGPVVVFPRGRLVGGGTATCDPDVWLDGVKAPLLDLDQIPPDRVEGLEVYRGAAAPLRYSTTCGAILIWTHVPEKRGKGGNGTRSLSALEVVPDLTLLPEPFVTREKAP